MVLYTTEQLAENDPSRRKHCNNTVSTVVVLQLVSPIQYKKCKQPERAGVWQHWVELGLTLFNIWFHLSLIYPGYVIIPLGKTCINGITVFVSDRAHARACTWQLAQLSVV